MFYKNNQKKNTYGLHRRMTFPEQMVHQETLQENIKKKKIIYQKITAFNQTACIKYYIGRRKKI